MADEEKAEEKKPGDDEDGGAAKAAESPWPGLLKDAAKQVLGVLLTGAGLLGFVAFAGAVIVWTRFEAIEVPPDQVVKAVPRDELVASGASLLLIFGFFGVLAVLATYLVDRGGRATPGVSRVLLGLVALEGITGIVLAGELSMRSVGIGLGFLFLVGLVLIATLHNSVAVYKDELAPREGETEDPLRGPNSIFDAEGHLRIGMGVMIGILALCTAAAVLLGLQMLVKPENLAAEITIWFGIGICGLGTLVLLRGASKEIKESQAGDPRTAAEAECKAEMKARSKRQVEEQKLKGRIEWLVRDLRREWEWLGGLARTPAATEKGGASAGKPMGKPRPHRLELTQRGVSMFLVLAGFAIILPAALLHHWWLAVSFGAAFVLAAGVWRVAVLPKSGFVWFGLVVFVSVPLFGTLTLMARNVEDPQVQPMAMIRATDGPGESIQGIYVTEASNRVYFANVATEGCENEVVKNSGRLLWVPKKEVVAMSIGPLQDVDDAGRSALEMAYALTPEVETPTGARVSLAVQEEEEGEKGGEAKGIDGESDAEVDGGAEAQSDAEVGSDKEAPADDEGKEDGGAADEGKGEGEAEVDDEENPSDNHRLENTGPAVRPNFGAGVRLVPAVAEPGAVVELRLSAPNLAVDGFGPSPEGLNLRLNGVRLAVLRVPAKGAKRAEYVKTTGGVVLPLEWYSEDDARDGNLVRLKEGSVRVVENGLIPTGLTLRLGEGGRLSKIWDPRENQTAPPSVTLLNGEEEELELGLLRRSWRRDRIKFRVPEDATTGVVSVECGQLAGQPVLTVVQPPTARVAVRMEPGSEQVTFDSSNSSDDSGEKLTRRWMIAGRRMGGEDRVSTVLPPRLGPYEVSLTLTDTDGLSDTVELRVLRLPPSRFPLDGKEPENKDGEVKRVLTSLGEAMEAEKPVAIEIEGHADASGSRRHNLKLSLERVERLRRLLFASAPVERKAAPLINDGANVPMVLRAFGESCPVVPAPGPQPINRRVEVFLLGPGATVAPGKGCRADRIKRISW